MGAPRTRCRPPVDPLRCKKRRPPPKRAKRKYAVHGRKYAVQGREFAVQGREIAVHGREFTVHRREFTFPPGETCG
eukprot:7561501-Pyramimonas_sp.AAC.1